MTSCQIVASTGIPSILFLIKKYGSKVDSFFSTGFDILKKVLFKCDESKKNLIATFIPLLIELMNMHAEELKPVKLKTGCTFLKHLAVFHDDHGEELFVNKIAATFNDMKSKMSKDNNAINLLNSTLNHLKYRVGQQLQCRDNTSQPWKIGKITTITHLLKIQLRRRRKVLLLKKTKTTQL